jgi:hypothetical protein
MLSFQKEAAKWNPEYHSYKVKKPLGTIPLIVYKYNKMTDISQDTVVKTAAHYLNVVPREVSLLLALHVPCEAKAG